MRLYTCTPVPFTGGIDFFSRDSGLLCRGLREIGIESLAVMPGEPRSDDFPELIRTEYENLESTAWWRSLKIDGVILYAWGRPKFRKVAKAIHQAGIFLVLNQDNGGLVSPLAGFRAWMAEQWILGGQGRGPGAWLRYLKLTLRGLSVGLALTDPLRAAHLKQGDVIACVSPMAANCYLRLCHIYGGADLENRVRVIPHPVEAEFHFSGGPKRRQVACIGRWQDGIQKRTWLLMEVTDSLLTTDDHVEVMIAGTTTPTLEAWQRSLPPGQRNRVRLLGFMARDELSDLLRTSQVFYSPSAFESFGIAAAEGLCSGCSVVAGQSNSMSAFEWFVSEKSGSLAGSDDCMGHARALHDELEYWAKGERDALAISDVWCERLHATQVAANVVEMVRKRSLT